MIDISKLPHGAIAEANGLTHDGNDIYVDREGNRFIVTKYGFEHVETSPTLALIHLGKDKMDKRIKELERTLGERNKQIDKLYNQLGKLLGCSSEGGINRAKINTIVKHIKHP